MSNYLETDFCSTEEGLDFIFGYMGAVYGASFTRHWEGVEADFVRQVWFCHWLAQTQLLSSTV